MNDTIIKYVSTQGITWKIEKCGKTYDLVSSCGNYRFQNISRGFARYVRPLMNHLKRWDKGTCIALSFDEYVKVFEDHRKVYYRKHNERLRIWSIKRVESGRADLLKSVNAILDEYHSYNEGFGEIESTEKSLISDRLLNRMKEKRDFLKKAIDILGKL